MVVATLFSDGAQAQVLVSDDVVPEFAAQAQANEIVVEMLVPDSVNDVGLELINGTPVDPRNFPGIVRMVTGGTCTAALIGPATILFAAHCLQGNTNIKFQISDRTIAGICQNSPGYNVQTHEFDWALCLLSNRISGIPYETVDVQNRPAIGDRLLLTGYGCTRQGGPLDGRLRVGFSDVIAQPASLRREPSAIFTHSAIEAGEAVLCPGDSGGPLFRAGADPTSARKIVGVNSRTTFELGISVFAATASPEGSAFLRSWAEANGQPICGVNSVANCK